MPIETFDPAVGLFLKLRASGMPATPDRARRATRVLAGLARYRGDERAPRPRDVRVPGGDGTELRARVYVPAGDGPFPTVAFFHGGGWVVGDVDVYDPQCRRLRDYARCAVVSVDYRLAPEFPFPAAAHDAIAATRWIAAHARELGGDPARVGVAGDSAGGNLAAVAALAMRDEGVPLLAQLLIYPGLDFVGLRSGEASLTYPSHARYATGYFLTLEKMNWYADRYIASDAARMGPLASPMHGRLGGVAPAVIATAGSDPLVDEGRAYASALRAAHVPVRYLEFPDTVHGFFALASLGPISRAAARTASRTLRELLDAPVAVAGKAVG